MLDARCLMLDDMMLSLDALRCSPLRLLRTARCMAALALVGLMRGSSFDDYVMDHGSIHASRLFSQKCK